MKPGGGPGNGARSRLDEDENLSHTAEAMRGMAEPNASIIIP
jgi:hypothetical protein